jgi:hypothetical protein
MAKLINIAIVLGLGLCEQIAKNPKILKKLNL